MSLMDRFMVLASKAQSNGIDKVLLQQVFYGSRMEGFDNGSDDITDVILWDEETQSGSQSAILFLDRDWNVSGFSWSDNEIPDLEWKDDASIASFFADCIAYARENGISLDDLGCADADSGEESADDVPASDFISGGRVKNLLNELRTTIEGNYCSMDDIAYVEMRDRNGRMVCISPAIFMDMASQIEYQDGRHEAAIHNDLKIVLKDGSFISRMWSDGSEWFRFYEKPDMNPNIVNLCRDDLCFFNSDMDRKD